MINYDYKFVTHNNNRYIAVYAVAGEGCAMSLYTWVQQLIGAPSTGADYRIMQCCTDLIDLMMMCITIIFIFVVLRVLFGKGARR